MNALEDLTISEIAQRIVDLQDTHKEGAVSQIAPIRQYITERHRDIALLKKDSEEITESISTLIDQYSTEQKREKERERIIKRVVYQKMEILITSTLNIDISDQNYHKKDKNQNYHRKDRKDLVDKKKEKKDLIEKIVCITGSLLSIAITSHIYYPFVIKMCRLLFEVSVVTDSFIPVTYYLLYMMNQTAKISASSIPLQSITESTIKVPEKYINSRIFIEYVMNNSLDLTVDCLIQHSQSLSFPEYSAYIIAEMKRVRNSPNKNTPWINSKTDSIIKGTREHAEKIERIREGMSAVNTEGINRLEGLIPRLHLSIE